MKDNFLIEENRRKWEKLCTLAMNALVHIVAKEALIEDKSRKTVDASTKVNKCSTDTYAYVNQ